MAESILKLKVNSEEYDQKIKRAAEGLQRYADGCRKAGGTLEHLDDGVLEFTKALGNMETVSKSARGKIGEMTKAFTDLSVEYKQLTDQEKASPFGKALSESLDQLKVRVQSAKQDLDEINKSLNGESSKVGGGLFGGGKLDGMLQVFGGNLMTKAAGWATSFAVELGDCVKQGIELARQGEGIRIAFERLNQPGLLDNLREATHGTVTDLELMKAAVKFNDFKLPVEELGTMLAFAQKKAKDTGQSVDYMVDSIVTGLGRKSLMILDNLGLSANDVKEKMKETGDMTKAVGEIIREQMANAGDYVETAADRATKANVDLQNAMTRLGETFQPLSDAGTSLWSDLKIGALDLLNNAVRPLIDALTEAGRIRSKYAEQGGDNEVQKQLGKLKVAKAAGSSYYLNNSYNSQISDYDSKIGSYEQYLSDYKKWQGDKTAVGAYDRMQAFQKQTGLSMYSDVKEQLEVFKKMRSEYVMGAKSIIADNPAPSPATPTDSKNGGSGKNTTPTAPTYAADSIAAQQELVSKLTKQWNEAGAEVRNSYIQPLVEAEAKLKTMKDQQALLKEQAQGRLLGDTKKTTITATVDVDNENALEKLREIEGVTIDSKTVSVTADTQEAIEKLRNIEGVTIDSKTVSVTADTQEALEKLREIEGVHLNEKTIKINIESQNVEIPITANVSDSIVQSIDEIREQLKRNPIVIPIESTTKDVKALQDTAKTTAKVVGTIGQAFNAIEDPAAKVAAVVAQAIANVALAYSDALAKTQGEKFNIWSFIAAAAASTASMVSTIASIHSATGYAQGGMIKGNSYSGDNIGGLVDGSQLVGLNAGEIVLNAAGQQNVAANLRGGAMGGMSLKTKVKGTELLVWLDNSLAQSGRGEMVTWGT